MCDTPKQVGVYLRRVVVTSLAERVLGVRKSDTSFDKSALCSNWSYQYLANGGEIDSEIIHLQGYGRTIP